MAKGDAADNSINRSIAGSEFNLACPASAISTAALLPCAPIKPLFRLLQPKRISSPHKGDHYGNPNAQLFFIEVHFDG